MLHLNEEELKHYASQYYDPAKAREYYLRTRELKGREASTEKLSVESRQNQAEASSYVRNEINTKRTADLKKGAEDQTAKLKELSATAKATQERIAEKLKALVEKLRADVETEVPKPELNVIPANATPKQREFLEKQNARITGEYNDKRRKAAAKANKSAKDATEAARTEIRKVGTDLRDAVETARTTYATAKKALVEKYSTDLKTELTNIKDQVR